MTSSHRDAGRYRGEAADFADTGDYTTALGLLEQARAAYLATGSATLEIADVDVMAAGYRYQIGDYAGALVAMRRAIAAIRPVVGVVAPDGLHDASLFLAAHLRHESLYLSLLDEEEQAAASVDEALSILRSHAGQRPDWYAEELAETLSRAAACRYVQSLYQEASPFADEAVQVAGDNRVDATILATALSLQAVIRSRLAPATAIQPAAIALEINRLRKPEPVAVGLSLGLLALCLLRAHDYERALRATTTAVYLLRETTTASGRRHAADVIATRAAAFAGLGDKAEALRFVDQVFDILGDEHDKPWNYGAVTLAAETRAAALG